MDLVHWPEFISIDIETEFYRFSGRHGRQTIKNYNLICYINNFADGRYR
jgi:hypothetical protein